MAGRRTLWVLTVVTIVVSLFVVGTNTAVEAAPSDHDGTDECDVVGDLTNHGDCPPAPAETPEPTCDLSTTSGQVGDAFVATVDNVPAGTQVQLRFDGETVATGDAPESGSTKLQGKVPDRPKGSYSVAAVGAGLTLANCGTFGRLEVSGGGTSNAPGRLALTGFQFSILLVIALALLVAGLLAMRASHHRRRRVSSRAAA